MLQSRAILSEQNASGETRILLLLFTRHILSAVGTPHVNT
jgi:hypothetical protein